MADEGGQDGEKHDVSAYFYHDFKGVHHNGVERGLNRPVRPVCVALRVKTIYFAGQKRQWEDRQVQGQKENGSGGRDGRGSGQAGGSVA